MPDVISFSFHSGDAVPSLPPTFVRRPSPAVPFSSVFDSDLSSSSSSSSSLCDPRVSPWVASARETCAEGLEYCWMSCLPLPPEDECAQGAEYECKNEADQDCYDDSMDATCHWTCPSPTEDTTVHASGGGGGGGGGYLSDFCNGAADMLMGGFAFSGKDENPCIILFIDSWTLVK